MILHSGRIGWALILLSIVSWLNSAAVLPFAAAEENGNDSPAKSIKETQPLFGGPYEVESFKDISYFEGDDADARKHKLDLFIPQGVKNAPVLFFVHGGAWVSGDRKLYGTLGHVFARNGVATVVISYRLSPDVKHPAHIEDVASAFAWTHKHIAEFGGRPDRIFVSGQSAGGHLAALLATNEKYLQAHDLSFDNIRGAIPISGIYTFRARRMDRIIGKGKEAVESASPLQHISEGKPPFLILYADNDFVGCSGMSIELGDALQKCKVDAEVKEIKDRNHISIMLRLMLSEQDATAQELLKFIAKRSDLQLNPRPTETATEATTTQEAADTFVYCSAAKDKSLVLLHMNSQSGALKKVAQWETPGEPGALTTSQDGSLLFAALRSTGRLASFRIDKSTGRLTPVSVVEAGADPAQISVDHSGRYLLTAYYVAGKVSVHRIGTDGSLSDLPEQELTTAEKAHAIVPDPMNRFAFVPHTGPNAIFQFVWNEKTGRLTPHSQQPRLQRPEQTGPRHMAWHPAKPIAYVDNEQGSSVTAYGLADDGSLKPGQTVPTLPLNFRESNSTAEIKVHPSGRFLYVSNRGHDSLAIVRIDESGETLTFDSTEPTEKTPRSFDIDPSGQFLLAAGESSGRLAVSKIDPDTGHLNHVQNIEIGSMLWWVQVVRHSKSR